MNTRAAADAIPSRKILNVRREHDIPNLFQVHNGERVMAFIDGKALMNLAFCLHFQVNFTALHEALDKHCTLVDVRYYTTLDPTTEDQPIVRMLDFLEYNGFTVLTKDGKEVGDSLGRRRIKGNMDVDFAVDMMRAVYDARIDHVIMFTGDSAFIPLVEAVKFRGVKVTAVSSISVAADHGSLATNPMSNDLRRICTSFIDLTQIQAYITKPSDRAAVSART